MQSLALLDLTRDQKMDVKMEDVGSLNAKGASKNSWDVSCGHQELQEG